MTPVHLAAAEARRLILQRQGLVRPFATPAEAVTAMVGVQTQYPGSLGVAVAARTSDMDPSWVEGAMSADGPLIRSWSLRNTLHAHLPEDHALVLSVLGPRLHARFHRWICAYIEPAAAESLQKKIAAALRRKPLTRDELHDAVPGLSALPHTGWGQDVMGLALSRRLAVIGRGAEQRFASLKPSVAKHTQADLLRRYLKGFGHGTIADFSHWAGLPQRDASSTFREMEEELVKLTVEGMPGTRYALKEGFHMEDEPLGLRLIAKFDPLILCHRDKGLFIPHEHRKAVIRSAGHIEAVVLSDGVAIATWRIAPAGRKVIYRIEPFRKFKRGERSALNAEAQRMAGLLGHTHEITIST